MVAIHIGAERNATIVHLAKPIELSVKGQVLQDPEDGDQKPETHHEPDKAAPVLERSEHLTGQKEEKDIGKQKLEFHAGVVGGGGAMKEPLAKGDQQERDNRQKQRRNDELMLRRQIG